jgi:hypothetical protein
MTVTLPSRAMNILPGLVGSLATAALLRAGVLPLLHYGGAAIRRMRRAGSVTSSWAGHSFP